MASQEYTLHYDPFSICSIMARMTLAFCPGDPSRTFHQKHVNIYKNEQLLEPYLTTVNPKGQVPAMSSPSLPEPLTDSLDITYFLCDLYPNLAPEQHEEVIRDLLKQLHEIQYLSLSFTPAQNRAGGITTAIEELQAQQGLSESYRKALKYKAEYHQRTLVHALEPKPISVAENQAREVFSLVENLASKFGGSGSWIFGEEVGPTALDAHIITFIARLYDADRKRLVPERLQRYGERAMQRREWQSVMDGRPTLHSLWVQRQGDAKAVSDK